jgi:hypothetical protein
MNTMALYDAVLKDDYQDVVRDQINFGSAALMSKIEQTSRDIEGGRKVVKAAPFGVNGGTGAMSESGALPAAGGNKYVNLVSYLKQFAGVISISEKLIEAANSDRAAFVNSLTAEMEGLTKGAKFSAGSGIYLPSTGIRATCGVTDDATTVVIGDTVQFLVEGMIIDIITTATGVKITNGTARRISSIDRANKTIVLEGTDKVTTAATHSIVEQGSYGNNFTGVADIMDQSADIYGLARTTYPWLKADVTAATGDITDAVIVRKLLDLENNAGAKTDLIVAAPDAYVEYYGYLESTKRTNNLGYGVIEGGFKSIKVNGIDMVQDRFQSSATMDLFDTSVFKMHTLKDWYWMQRDGAILKHKSGYAAYEAILIKFAELICDHIYAQGRLAAITIN